MAVLVGATAGNNGGGATSLVLKVSSPTGPWAAGRQVGPSAQNLVAVAYDGTRWVAAGTAGTLIYATDPTGAWTQNNQGSTAFGRHGLVYGNGYWVAVGLAGTLYYATDPTAAWTSNAQGSADFTSVAYGNGYFVAVGVTGTLWYKATDPTGAWTQNTQGAATFRKVNYDNGYWVAVGESGTLRYKATDPTGAWTSNTQGTNALYGIDWDGTRFVIAGLSGTVLYRSTDPTGAFTANTQGGGTPQFNELVYGNGYWVTADDTLGDLYWAADPTGAWTKTLNPNGVAVGIAESIAFAGGYWLFAGDQGYVGYIGSVVDGDVLLMAVGVVGGSGTTITDPAGWTLLGPQVNSGTALAQKLYWRLASSEPSSYTVTITSNKASGVISIVRGADSTAPASAQYAGQANASSLTVTYPALGSWTSTDGVDSVFGVIAQADTPAAPTNYTQTVFSASTGGGASSRTTSEHAYRALSAVTTVGSVTAAWTGTAAVNIGHHVFIKTASAPTPPEPIRVGARQAVIRASAW